MCGGGCKGVKVGVLCAYVEYVFVAVWRGVWGCGHWCGRVRVGEGRESSHAGASHRGARHDS